MTEPILDLLPPGVVLAADAADAGVHADALARAVRAGALTRVRTGAYVRTQQWRGATPEGRHRFALSAAARQLRDPVFCLESAAVAWGLPLVEPIGALHVLGPRTAGAALGYGTRGDLTRHGARRVGAVEQDGLSVTSAHDTVLDLAAARDLRRALPVADAALRLGLVTRETLSDGLAARTGQRGVRRARVLVALADGSAESPGESVSRARMHLDGFVLPELQVDVRDRDGLIGRVDFCWRVQGVVGEFDGRVKYRAEGVPDERPVEERVWAEKRREDGIRAGGLRVARWTWRDAWPPGPLARLLTTMRVPLRRETH